MDDRTMLQVASVLLVMTAAGGVSMLFNACSESITVQADRNGTWLPCSRSLHASGLCSIHTAVGSRAIFGTLTLAMCYTGEQSCLLASRKLPPTSVPVIPQLTSPMMTCFTCMSLMASSLAERGTWATECAKVISVRELESPLPLRQFKGLLDIYDLMSGGSKESDARVRAAGTCKT